MIAENTSIRGAKTDGRDTISINVDGDSVDNQVNLHSAYKLYEYNTGWAYPAVGGLTDIQPYNVASGETRAFNKGVWWILKL